MALQKRMIESAHRPVRDGAARSIVESLEIRRLLSTTVNVYGNNNDIALLTDGSTRFAHDVTVRVGDNGTNTAEQNWIIPFQLPAQGGAITAASLTTTLSYIPNSPSGGVDLYGLGWRSGSAAQEEDYFVGGYGTDLTDATPIQNNYAIASSSGALTTSSPANTALVDYINGQIDAGAGPGDFIFLRANAQAAQGTAKYWVFHSGDAATPSQRPLLTLTYDSPPAAPSGLTAVAASTSQINLAWTDNASNETGFAIDRATNSTFTSGLVTSTVSANVKTYQATGLSNSTTYYFRVRATNAAGSSANTATASAATAAPLISENFASGAGNFTVVDGTWAVVGGAYQITTANTAATDHLNNRVIHNTSINGDFTLTVDASTAGTGSVWNDFAILFGYQDAGNYYFFSSNESNDDKTSGIIEVNNGVAMELADITLPIASDTPYAIKVQRSGNTINVYRNNVLVATAEDSTYLSGKVGLGTKGDGATFDNFIVNGTSLSTPAAPSGLTATAASTTQINLAWTDNANNETGLVVDRATNSGFTAGLVTTPLGSNATSYQAAGLSPSTTYYFRVRAVNANGASANSATASATTQTTATTPAAPTALTATAVSPSQINLSWADNATTETGYAIDRATNSSFTTGLVTTTAAANATSVNVTGLAASTTYYFRVRATNAAGASAPSNTANATTPASGVAKPGPTNTGPYNPGALVSRGSLTVSTAGAVVENVDISGVLYIKANNVTVRNFRINAGGSYYAVRIDAGVTGTVFEDGEATNFAAAFSLYASDYTARRLRVHDVAADAFGAASNVLIESCWIYNIGMGGGGHTDGLQIQAGRNVVVRNNFFDLPIDLPGYNTTSNIMIKTDKGTIDNVLIEGNWMNGGNYTLYIRPGIYTGNPVPTNITVLNNRFGRDYRYGLFLSSGTPTFSGNVWDDTGAAVPLP